MTPATSLICQPRIGNDESKFVVVNVWATGNFTTPAGSMVRSPDAVVSSGVLMLVVASNSGMVSLPVASDARMLAAAPGL